MRWVGQVARIEQIFTRSEGRRLLGEISTYGDNIKMVITETDIMWTGFIHTALLIFQL